MKKQFIVLVLIALFVGGGLVLGYQSLIPSRQEILEKNIQRYDEDISLHQKQIDVLMDRKKEDICILGAIKISEGEELQSPKVYAQLCGDKLGLAQE